MGDGAGAAGFKTIRPNGVAYNYYGWRTQAGSSSSSALYGAVSDDSDATYIKDGAWRYELGLNMGSPGALGTQRIKQVRSRLRYLKVGSSSSADLRLSIRRDTSDDIGVMTAFPQVSSITTATGPWWTIAHGSPEWTAWAESLVLALYPLTNYTYSNVWNVYELYLDLDIRSLIVLATPTLTETFLQRPTVNWTATPNPDGDAQQKYQVFVYPSAIYNAAGFVAGTSAGWTWTSGETVGSTQTLQIGADLTFGATYKAFVRVAQDFNGADWWTVYSESAAFTPLPNSDATPLPPTPALVRTVDDTHLKVILDVTAGLNRLTANQSSLEVDTTGWAAGTTTTIARVSNPVFHGIGSLGITKITSGGTASATTPTGTSGVPVLGSTTYTAMANFRAAVTGRSCTVRVKFYTAAGSYLSSGDLTSGGATDNTSGWVAATVTGASPATAAFAAVEVQIASAALSEVHYIDKIGLHPGSSTTWTLGGYLADSRTAIRAEQQETVGPNFLPANVADGGLDGTTTGFYKRTAGDLLDLYGAAPLLGEHSIRWGPSAAASVLDAGFLTTAPVYDVAPLAAPNKTMTASAYVRAETGTFQVALIVGAHNAAGSVATGTGSTVTVGTTWTRITASVAVPDSGLYTYVAFDNTGDTTTGRLLIDQVQLEIGATAAAWAPGTGDRPATWSALRASPIAGTLLPLGQEVWFHDFETKAGKSIRLYRVRSEAYDTPVVGTAGIISSAHAYAAAYNTPVERIWWLKDPLEPGLNWSTQYVLDTINETIAEDLEVVHPLGRPYPVSVSSWVSAGADGTLQIQTSGEQDWRSLEALLRRPNALLLQSPGGLNKYIRVTERNWERRGHRRNLQRVISMTYVEEGAP